MASNKFLTAAIGVAASVSVAAFAGCTPPTGTGTPGASAKPSTPATTAPSTAAPSAPASGTPSAPASGASATPAPTAIPSTPDTSSRATVHGVVYDDVQQRLSDVTVHGKVLGSGTFANGSDTLSTNSQVGSYALNGAPTGQTILVTVTKNGFTTRQQTIVPLANLQGDPAANRLDFGTADAAGNQTFSMSDKPEVTSMTPAPDATGVDPATTFTLTWSEPVNTADVENYWAVAAGEKDYALTNGVELSKDYDPATDKFVGGGAVPTKQVYDQSGVSFAWSNNNQTVTVSFRPGNKLPTDKDSSKLPQFAQGFTNSVRDAASSGTRADKFFRTSPAQIGKNGYRFTVAADTTKPRLLGTTAMDAFSGAPSGAGSDAMRFQFSETMVLYPSNLKTSADGSVPPDKTQTRSALNAALYAWAVQALQPADFAATKAVTGAAVKVVLDANDATRSTILSDMNSAAKFAAGNRVWGSVDTTVEDPAANTIDTSNNVNTKSSIAI